MGDFLDESKREEWVVEKNLLVFSLFSPAHQATEIDVFVEPPFDFDPAFAAVAIFEVAPGVAGSFCSLADLNHLKKKAGRPIDLEDVAELEQLGNSGELA